MIPLPDNCAKAIWKKAVKASNEPANVKAVLLRISWHLNEDGRRSSISVTQLASECRLSDATVKRVLRVVRGVWVDVEFNKGIKRSTGRENLYHARLPETVNMTGTNCGKGGQAIVARGVGSVLAVTPVPSKKEQTVRQGKNGKDRTPTSLPSNVLDFNVARLRLAQSQLANRRAAL